MDEELKQLVEQTIKEALKEKLKVEVNFDSINTDLRISLYWDDEIICKDWDYIQFAGR